MAKLTVFGYTCFMYNARDFRRINSACKIEYIIEKDSAFTTTESKNFSEVGICLVTDHLLAVGTVIRCKIHLHATEDPIHVLGKIVWSLEKQIGPRAVYDNGISFLEIQDRDRAVLEEYIREQEDDVPCGGE